MRWLVLVALLEFVSVASSSFAQSPSAWKFDFGGTRVEKGWDKVDVATTYTPAQKFGWTRSGKLEQRDRGEPDLVRRDFVFSSEPARFRADLKPGKYTAEITFGDFTHGDHGLKVVISGSSETLPVLRAIPAEFVTLSTGFEVTQDHVEFAFDSQGRNWVVNALSIYPSTGTVSTRTTREQFQNPEAATWAENAQLPDRIAPFVKTYRERMASTPAPVPTGITRADYLEIMRTNVQYFLTLQDRNGAVIDPVRREEYQYATPCFAAEGAALIQHAGRTDLIEPVARAVDWSVWTLSRKKAATSHEDFFAPVLAHTLPLMKNHVPAERYAKWESQIRSFDPYYVYRSGPGGGNWNVVALSGEWLFHKSGLRKDVSYVADSMRAQAQFFHSPWGMYTEGPMPYDHFPRLWAANMVAQGYDGPWSKELSEVLRRGALTSLFMQSPWGELPAGGRSAHHQWNEAEQCVTYEIYAAKALRDGDAELAGVFKRAARLALGSMKRWVRPSGELWIVKNRMEPETQHGYEGYSSHSQYNTLPMAMLVIAYEHAASTENVKELATPAEIGGFVLSIDQPMFNKVFANAGGQYVELDTRADLHYNATGLLRVHSRNVEPQLGPSDALTTDAIFMPRDALRATAAVAGVGWKTPSGKWKQLGEFGRDDKTTVAVEVAQATSESLRFRVTYAGEFDGPEKVIENYVITPDRVEIAAELPGYRGPVQMVWPVLVDDGKVKPVVELTSDTLRTRMALDWRVFGAPGCSSLSIGKEQYVHRNGWSKIARAEWHQGPGRVVITTAR